MVHNILGYAIVSCNEYLVLKQVGNCDFEKQNVWSPAEMWGIPSQLFVPTAGYYVRLVAPKIKEKNNYTGIIIFY